MSIRFSALVPFSDPGIERDPISDMNPTVNRFLAREERLGRMHGIPTLGGIARFASRHDANGLVVGYRTSTQMPDALAVAKLIAHHVADLGVRVIEWGDA